VSVWTARRFWTTAEAVPVPGGFAVHLDARPVRTPLKAALILPTPGLAEAVAAEWQAQDGKVDPLTMPFTRTANSAIDTVARQFDEVAELIAAYGASDLLCYRAEGPADLVARQAEGWDPILAWVETGLGAGLTVTIGIIPVDQPQGALAALRGQVRQQTPFQLAAFHELVALSGSLVLALAVTRRQVTAEAAWTLSRIDEDWQSEVWGKDEDAAELAAVKRDAFLLADRFYGLCG
jgi:chaperone required for assembly of F1-ATPase